MQYIYWSIDTSFAVHSDVRSHTGALMSLRKGDLIAMSIKQKLNTTSSAEAKLVGVSDSMPFSMRATYFFEAQGQGVTDYKLGIRNIFYQDNESCIKLANNSKTSSTN